MRIEGAYQKIDQCSAVQCSAVHIEGRRLLMNESEKENCIKTVNRTGSDGTC